MAYPIDAALSEYYEEYIWTITDSDYDTLEWDSSNSISKPTKSDLESKLAVINAAEPMKRLRFHRDKLLQECDWVVTKATETGVAETDAWKTYRLALRDLESTQTPEMEAVPTTQLGIKNVTWPTKPS